MSVCNGPDAVGVGVASCVHVLSVSPNRLGCFLLVVVIRRSV
jgi:hypothetical protein